MCGIAGIVSFRDDMRGEMKVCESMQHALRRRGPDQRGIAMYPEAALVHTRLAVIDAEGGRQPMTLRQGEREYTIVYNGELYNSGDIRRELAGEPFLTRSDTETVLRSYMKWGGECVEHFNGIYAFAVYDKAEHRVFLARDRIGVKPLFYAETGSRLIFASELPALLCHPDVPAEIDAEGAAELLLIAPGRTPGCGVFRNVREVKPGWCGTYDASGLHLHEYWRLRAQETEESFEETAEKVHDLVLDSIKRQLVSDVPVCTFLSGGLDSSLISSVTVSELKKEGKQLTTFSVHYAGNEKYFRSSRFQPESDDAYITRMAEYLGSDHHRVTVEVPELTDALYEAVEARGLPGMADVDASLLLLCREIKKYGTVALSGECADEFFGGYPWYRDKDIRMTDGFPWAQSTAYRKRFLAGDIAAVTDAEDYVYSRYRETADYAEKLTSDSETEGRMREMMQLNVSWFMQTLLDRKDRMSMYSGLEVRVPFCDHRIAEYLYNVRWEYKDWQGREKGLLRHAMREWLPEEVLWRKKSPYPKTHDPAFLAAVTERLREILSAPTPLTDIVRREELEKLLRHEEKVQWYGQLMNLPQTIAFFIQLDCWMKRFRVRLV